jgi:hypothetical protein
VLLVNILNIVLARVFLGFAKLSIILHTTVSTTPKATLSHTLCLQQCNVAKIWDCKLLLQESSCLGDESTAVDLCEKKREHSDYIMFPGCYVGAESIDKLLTDISLVVGSRAARTTLLSKIKNTHRIYVVRLECGQTPPTLFVRRQRIERFLVNT